MLLQGEPVTPRTGERLCRPVAVETQRQLGRRQWDKLDDDAKIAAVKQHAKYASSRDCQTMHD